MVDPDDLVQRLRRAATLADRPERTVQLAAVISDALRQAGIRAVLVGGAAVEIYTRAMYTTADLDFVAGGDEIPQVMERLGLERRGRVWVHEELAVVVEFPSSTLGKGRSETLTVGSTPLEIIAVEDLLVDRLAAWKHWGWHPDGVSAALLLELHGEDLDDHRLAQRAGEEEVLDVLHGVRELLEHLASNETLTEESLGDLHRELFGA